MNVVPRLKLVEVWSMTRSDSSWGHLHIIWWVGILKATLIVFQQKNYLRILKVQKLSIESYFLTPCLRTTRWKRFLLFVNMRINVTFTNGSSKRSLFFFPFYFKLYPILLLCNFVVQGSVFFLLPPFSYCWFRMCLFLVYSELLLEFCI